MAPPTSARHRTPSAYRRGRAAVLVATLGCAALLGSPERATANWLASGGGAADAAATVAPPGPVPSLSRNGITGAVTVSWSAVTLAGQPVTGYLVRRYSGTTASPVTSGSCTGSPTGTVPGTSVPRVVTTTSCTDDRGFFSGSYTYKVVPVFREWLGVESSGATI